LCDDSTYGNITEVLAVLKQTSSVLDMMIESGNIMQLLYQYALIGFAIIFLLVTIIILSGPLSLYFSRPAPSAQHYALKCIRNRQMEVIIQDAWIDSNKWTREAFLATLQTSPDVVSVKAIEFWKQGRGGTHYTITYQSSRFPLL
jgi:hypothetical protein